MPRKKIDPELEAAAEQKLVEEKEHHHNDPVAVSEAYFGLLPNRQRGLVLAFPLSQRFFGDPLPGE